MNKHPFNHPLATALVVAVAILGSQSALAQSVWNGNSVIDSTAWNDATNWTPTGVPNGASVEADLTVDDGNFGTPLTVDLGSTSETVGILKIGTSDSVAGGTYTLESTGGGTLTLDNGGHGAQINEVAGSVGDTIDTSIVMNDNLTITDSSSATSTAFVFGGAISGTGNLTINNDSANTGSDAMFFSSGATINNSGELIFDGTTTSADSNNIRLEGAIGSNVSEIVQNSSTTIAHTVGQITVNAGGTTFINNGGAALNISQQGIVGTGNITVENNTSIDGAIDFSQNGEGLNNVGTITSTGTGTGRTLLGAIGSNVTSVIIASGATSGIRFNNGAITVNASGTTLVNNSTTAGMEIVNGSNGTGDLILENNGSVDFGINFDQGNIDNAGFFIDQGTSTGSNRVVVSGSGGLGSNLQGVIQDSANSVFFLALGSDTTATGFTGILEVKNGTMQLQGNNFFTNASQIIAGDTKADGPGSQVLINMNSGSLTTGAAQTLSGFGSFTNNSIATVAGTTIAPGSAGNIGKLSISSNLTLAGGTNLTFALGQSGVTPGAGTSSMLAVGGALNLPALTLDLNLSDNADANGDGTLSAGEYELMSYNSLTGATLGDITSLFNISGPGGFNYDLTDTSITGPGEIDLTVVAAPEPGAWAMLLGGLGMLLGVQRLRSRKV